MKVSSNESARFLLFVRTNSPRIIARISRTECLSPESRDTFVPLHGLDISTPRTSSVITNTTTTTVSHSTRSSGIRIESRDLRNLCATACHRFVIGPTAQAEECLSRSVIKCSSSKEIVGRPEVAPRGPRASRRRACFRSSDGSGRFISRDVSNVSKATAVLAL